MATKRPHASVHPSRQDQVPAEPSRKKRKPNIKAGAKSFKKAHPVNELKSRIRSLKRQLERNESLTAVAQQEKERALRAAEDELERNVRAKQRNDMIGKWHRIRFFDRRKAEKRLKRAKKELQDVVHGDAKTAALEKKASDAEVDVKYAIYYPLEKDYVPLFPRRKKGSDDEDKDGGDAERKGDPVMWETIKQCKATGTLDALRNGRLDQVRKLDEVSEESRPAKKRQVHQQSKARSDGKIHSDGDSDEGGNAFWE